MKKDWKVKTIGDICEIKGRIGFRGYTKSDLVKKGEGAITLSPSNIKDYKLDFSDCSYISWYKYDESPEIQLSIGDIVFCKTASIGKLAIVEYLPEKTTLNPQFIVLKKIQCERKFLYYYLFCSSFKEKIKKITTGTAVPTLSQKNFSELPFPIPPLEEQKRIVAVLDKKFAQIETLKTAAEKNLQNTKQLFQAELEKAFSNTSWEKKTIQEICTLKSGNSSTNNSKPGTLPYVKVGDMTIVGNEKSITTSTTFVDYESNKKQVFPIGSVIFPKRGGAILTNKKRITAVEICCDLNIMGVIPGEKITSSFLYYYFIGIDFSKLCNGASIPQINNIDINPLEINLPPLEEQKRIVAHLDSLSEKVYQLEEIYIKQLADCDELKQSLLQKAFEGEL